MNKPSKDDTAISRLAALFRQRGVLSVRDPECARFPSVCFSRLLAAGVIDRIGSGVYSCPAYPGGEWMANIEAAAVVPKGVACLFTALKYHGLTLENPHRLHLAVPKDFKIPANALPADFHHFTPDSWAFGIDEVSTRDGRFRVYCVEKTLADCFKFRNAIGLDVAIAALREACGKMRLDHEKLRLAVEVCRMKKVMRPYLDSFYA